MQNEQVQQETSKLFELNFMGKLYYVLNRPDYFHKIITWRSDEPNIIEIHDEEKFAWALVPYLISPNSTIFTWHEALNCFGFVPAFLRNNPHKLYSKKNLDSTSSKQDWIKEWKHVRIERYFSRSQEGLMYKALKSGSRYLRWREDGVTLEIRNADEFVRKEIYPSSSKSVKSFIGRLRNCRFFTKASGRSSGYYITHPSLNADSSQYLKSLYRQAWFNIFELAAYRSRVSARMRKELKHQIDKECFLEKVEPPPLTIREHGLSGRMKQEDTMNDFANEHDNFEENKTSLQEFRDQIRQSISSFCAELDDLRKTFSPVSCGQFTTIDRYCEKLLSGDPKTLREGKRSIEENESGVSNASMNSENACSNNLDFRQDDDSTEGIF